MAQKLQSGNVQNHQQVFLSPRSSFPSNLEIGKHFHGSNEGWHPLDAFLRLDSESEYVSIDPGLHFGSSCRSGWSNDSNFAACVLKIGSWGNVSASALKILKGHVLRNQLKQIYKIAIRIPGMKAVLIPIVRRAKQANFNFDKSTSLGIRIIFLESAVAGLEERLSNLENKN